jgi:hypothetical protein
LEETESLTFLSKQVKDKKAYQLELALDTISTSQLSRKLGSLSPKIFKKIFHHLVLKTQANLKQPAIIRDIGRLYVIDSTTMSMSLSQYPWATFRKTKAGIRLHLRVIVTKELTIPDNSVYWMFVLSLALKKNVQIEVLSEQVPDPESRIFRDQEVFLGNGQNGTKMIHPLRLVETKDREGNTVIIVTNCFELSANEIGELYRYRWKIETFFKWMKQHLKIKSFYGKSENAVCNQIWIALITYCLQVLLQQSAHHEGPLLEIKQT